MSSLEEIFSNYNVSFEYKNVIGYEFIKCSISKNDITVLDLRINADSICVGHVQKCLIDNTSELLDKVKIFARTNPLIKRVYIGFDDSHLVFVNLGTKYFISLKALNLLAYGQTWYNRIGFGKQSDTWKDYINSPFICQDIYWSRYNGYKISEVFLDIILNLRNKSLLIDNVKYIDDVTYIKEVDKLLMSYVPDYDFEQDDLYEIYRTGIPPVNYDTTYYL